MTDVHLPACQGYKIIVVWECQLKAVMQEETLHMGFKKLA